MGDEPEVSDDGAGVIRLASAQEITITGLHYHREHRRMKAENGVCHEVEAALAGVPEWIANGSMEMPLGALNLVSGWEGSRPAWSTSLEGLQSGLRGMSRWLGQFRAVPNASCLSHAVVRGFRVSYAEKRVFHRTRPTSYQ